jgi:hypothetical protein
VADQALLAQLGQGAKWLGDGLLGGALRRAHPQVGHVEDVQAKVLQVLVDLGLEVVGIPCHLPGAVLAAASTDLGDDVQVVGVGVQGLLDELVDDREAVIVEAQEDENGHDTP